MKRWLLALLALLAALAGTPAAAQPQFPARPEGPVLDAAGLLPADREAALDARLREYNARTGRSLIVVTVPTLQEDTIEDYSVRLFEAWGIGGKETDQGLLLLVAPNERKVRIEVGYGLHQYVTDILSGRIVRDEITPRFKQGDFPGGIEAGVNALVTQLDRDPADAKAVAEAAAAAERERGSGGGSTIGGAIFWIVMIVFFMLVFGRRGRRRHGVVGAVGDVILWSAINGAMNSGRSDGGGWGGGGGGGGGGFGGFGGGMSGGGGASGSW